jgi:hypothetical protein
MNGFDSVCFARVALVRFVLPDFNGGPLKRLMKGVVHRIPL